ADFMHALRASAPVAKAGDEFDDGVCIVRLLVPRYIEAEPFHALLFGEVERSGAGARMPGVEQIRFQTEHVGTVARPHEFVRALRHGTVMEPAAAFGIAAAGAAWAGRAVFDHRVMGL